MSILPEAIEVASRRRAGLELLRAAREDDTRVVVLSTFNVDLFPPFLVEALARAGITAKIEIAPFGQLNQQVLDPTSSLYDSPPASVIVIPAVEDLLEQVFDGGPAGPALVDERLAELRALVGTILDRLPTATCYLVVFGTDRVPRPQVLDPGSAERGQVLVERFLDGIRSLRELSPRAVVVDWDWHVRRVGWHALRDERLWYVGRMRLSPVGLAALADVVARHDGAVRGVTRKVVALDLDGTLWGGIVGELGVGGIEVGGEGVGLAHQDLQRELLKLHSIGVLLVACSKNNPDDAVEVFEQRPEMLIRREHLAGERINWEDKATNLRELAEELNLGLDSFVFLDDNPVERSWIRQACPDVLVPELPKDPVEWPDVLRSAPWFDRIQTTDADLRRAATYRDEKQRRELQTTARSFESFLESLEQEVVIEPLRDAAVSRAVQLCQRTNQFNLTTKRYATADLEQMLDDPDYELYTLAVEDRFGESGVTGFAILRVARDGVFVDTFLLSCRVLGRKVEDAFLAFLAERAIARGAATLIGLFEPTKKNSLATTFYADRGFAQAGAGVFRYDLTAGTPEPPPAVEVRVRVNA